MEEYCPFLEAGLRWRGDSPYRCAIGVNFYSVGRGRELCRTCPIADRGQALLCEHLDVYTFLQVDPKGKQSIQVEMECQAPDSGLADFRRCDICPARRAVEPDEAQGLDWRRANRGAE
ncbi:MAG: hypothetical protein ACE5MB_09550 [Anaerolineae bacterium]